MSGGGDYWRIEWDLWVGGGGNVAYGAGYLCMMMMMMMWREVLHVQ